MSDFGSPMAGLHQMFEETKVRLESVLSGGLRDGNSHDQDAEELATGLLEHLRWLSQTMSDWAETPENPAVPNAARELARELSEQWLPFNRKERYFTGTVLPMIVASDGFAHLDRFLRMCGIDAPLAPDYLGDQALQFFTEYSFRESVFFDADKRRFPDLPATKDTPDVVLAGSGWLLAIEAKMYQRPNKAKLETQLQAQSELIHYIAQRLSATGTPINQVRHIALVPRSHLPTLSSGSPLKFVDATITWQDLADEYADVAPRYWIGQLQHANDNDLTDGGKGHQDGFRTGEQILSGDLTHLPSGEPYTFMGCQGGLDGDRMRSYIKGDTWRTREFQVRRTHYQHNNWFSIEDFRARISSEAI